MTNIQDLLAQKAALEKQIAEAQRAARSDALVRVRELMAEYGLTAADLTGRVVSSPKLETTKKVAVKYHDPVSGQSWTGRGLKPKWLTQAINDGKQISDFAV